MYLTTFESLDKDYEWDDGTVMEDALFEMREFCGGKQYVDSMKAKLILADGREIDGWISVNYLPNNAFLSKLKHNARRAGRKRNTLILESPYDKWTWKEYCEYAVSMTVDEILEELRPILNHVKWKKGHIMDMHDEPVSKRTFEARLSAAKKRAKREDCDDIKLEDMLNS